MGNRIFLLLAAFAAVTAAPVHARTVYRCVNDGTVSVATAPEPGSKCTAKTLDDAAAKVPNLWGALGTVHGTLYQREQDGVIVYGTRRLPGSSEVLRFTVVTPPGSPAHAGLGTVGKPRLGVYKSEFASAARKTGVDEALLRAVAHAESAYAPDAVSNKGAKGVMQLMPGVISDYGVADPFSPKQSILAGAKYLKALETRYEGDALLAAAAYNAGAGAVAQYGGVPPYAETRSYVAKVSALYASYREAMGLEAPTVGLRAAE